MIDIKAILSALSGAGASSKVKGTAVLAVIAAGTVAVASAGSKQDDINTVNYDVNDAAVTETVDEMPAETDNHRSLSRDIDFLGEDEWEAMNKAQEVPEPAEEPEDTSYEDEDDGADYDYSDYSYEDDEDEEDNYSCSDDEDYEDSSDEDEDEVQPAARNESEADDEDSDEDNDTSEENSSDEDDEDKDNVSSYDSAAVGDDDDIGLSSTLDMAVENGNDEIYGAITDSEIITLDEPDLVPEAAYEEAESEDEQEAQGSPQEGAVSRFTLPEWLTFDANGVPENYSKVLTGNACAYTAEPDALMSTGKAVFQGYVAVDPDIIPYGSQLYIVADDGDIYGYAIAADTGYSVRAGHIIVDLFMDEYDDCIQWGNKGVKIYVLD